MKTLREIIKERGLTNKAISESLGIAPNNFARYDDLSKRNITELKDIAKALDMPIDELIKEALGYNLVLKKSNENNMNTNLPESVKSVYLLPVSAHGGTLSEFVESVKEKDCEKIISPIRDADFAITVSGESMAPEYPNGAQILIKKINEKAFIDWGRAYVLDTCNGVVVKRVFPTEDKNPSKLKCVSVNPEYPPFEVNMKDVYGMYRVMLCMSQK